MRQNRMAFVLLLLVLGTFGAWMGVRAQDRRTPWPPAPITPPDSIAQSMPQPPPPLTELPAASHDVIAVEHRELVADALATLTSGQVATPAVADSAAPTLPRKLPPEIPATPGKATAKPPGEPAPMPSVPAAALPTAPELIPTMPTPVRKNIAKPGESEAPTPLPRIVEGKKTAAANDVVAALPDPPKVDPQPKSITPPAPSAGSDAKIAAAAQEKKSPIAPLPIPDVVAPPAPSPIAVPDVMPPQAPSSAAPAAPLPVPPPQAPMSAPPAAPLPSPPQAPTTAPPRVATPPVEIKETPTPSRPPAFLLVKPRRNEAPPPNLVVPFGAESPSPVAPRPSATPLASSAAQVTVEKLGPSVLRQGSAATYSIHVRNRGAAVSGAVTVVDEIPALARIVGGDPMPAQLGDKAIWTLPPLPPGSETLLKFELQASGSGEFVGNTTVFVSAATATTRTQIQRDAGDTLVVAGPLSIQVRGPASAGIGQTVVFEVQATNHGREALTELVLHAKLGAGLSHPAGASIEADVGQLAPGASKTFKVPTTAVGTGRFLVEVKLSAAAGSEAQAQTSVEITKEASGWTGTAPPMRAQNVAHVEGNSTLALVVTPRDTVLAAGKETVCEVRVQNFGGVPETGVQLRFELPAGMSAGYVQGPAQHQVLGRSLVFEPISKLPAQAQAVFHIGVTAQAAGELKLRAQASSDQHRAAVSRETALLVYRD